MDRVLAGRYALEKEIGAGGMATVWRARDTRLDRFVAVKLMEERLSSDTEFRARFLQEARAAASFSHPNVVDVLDYGEEEGVPYIVMELVEGEDLRSLIERQRRLPSGEVARIGAEVARGLAAAHRRGLVHRDIKPANILLADDGTPKLADFGIARALGTATNTKAGTMLGSVHYLSPEQVQGASVDARSDLYSLGVVLYEAATGQRPFDDDAPAAIAVQRLNETPLPPHAVEPTLPQWLSNVIERAMQREPERRYPSASELERDLRARRAAPPPGSLEDTVAVPVPVGAPAATLPRVRGRPRRAGSQNAFALPLLVALALIGLGAYLVFAQQAFAVPLVEGRERDEAREILLRQGLRVDILSDPSEKPRGIVFRQEPRPPALVRQGDTVTIYVSEGPGLVTIPVLRGRTVDEASQILERAGLKRGTTFQQADDGVPAGRVIQSEPTAGAAVPAGFTVDLVVSTGPRPTPTPTPTPAPTPTPSPTPAPTPTLSLPLPLPTPRR